MIRYLLIGDAESPHLLKWARALSSRVDLWIVSSRGFLPEYDGLIGEERRLSLRKGQGLFGWIRLFLGVRTLGIWLRSVDADYLNPHYVTSHGLLIVLCRYLFRLRGRVIASAWGSDILIFPNRGLIRRMILARILRDCFMTTSDSRYVAERMIKLGAKEVMVFPFGVNSVPTALHAKDDGLFFANRALEPIYNPFGALRLFLQIMKENPGARLVVANSGSMLESMKLWVKDKGIVQHVEFVGRLNEQEQEVYYSTARWLISVPYSDAVSVSIIEGMSHGCIPIVSDLPANRELILHEFRGYVLPNVDAADLTFLRHKSAVLDSVSQRNRIWVRDNAIFPKSIDNFLNQLSHAGCT